MPTFRIEESGEGQRKCLREYQTKIMSCITRLGYPIEDVRGSFLNDLIPPAAAYITALNFRIYFPKYPEAIISVLDLAQVSKESIQMAVDDSSTTAKKAFVTTSQFTIENAFKLIVRAIDPKNETDKFRQLARETLEACKVADAGKKFEMLYTPALIRNTLHTNGRHTMEPVTYTIHGVEYKFEKGQRITCAHLCHVVHAMSSAVDVVEEILASAPVRKLSSVVDPFNEQRARSQQGGGH